MSKHQFDKNDANYSSVKGRSHSKAEGCYTAIQTQKAGMSHKTYPSAMEDHMQYMQIWGHNGVFCTAISTFRLLRHTFNKIKSLH